MLSRWVGATAFLLGGSGKGSHHKNTAAKWVTRGDSHLALREIYSNTDSRGTALSLSTKSEFLE